MPKVPIHSVVRPVLQLRACLDRVSSTVLRKKMGFGSSQLRIMYVLANKPEMTQKVIADFWDVTEASVSRQIKILVDKGYAEKRTSKKSTANNSKNNEKSPHGHGMAITTQGKKALDLAMKEISQTFEKIFSEVSDEDRKRVTDLLEDFIEKIRSDAHFK